MATNNRWVKWAIQQINADFTRSADTHLLKVDLPVLRNHDIHLYLKDESTHPTGSLKHRLARSLFLYGISNGWISDQTTVIESSSGSTAISEAYFARLLNLPFVAVVPEETSEKKIQEIAFWGGQCKQVAAADISTEARAFAQQSGGHYMDQFTYAERATDWRGNNNIAMSIFQQLSREPYPQPAYVVMSAGTGGTSATIGRYLRYHPECSFDTKLVVPDPENSVYLKYFQTQDRSLTSSNPSRIEGIGRPQVEPSFLPSVIDDMIRVTDADSVATARFLEPHLGKKVGASTGTNVYAAFRIIEKMIRGKRPGSVVSLICDSGDRYGDTYFNDLWLEEHGLVIHPAMHQLERFVQSGQLVTD